MSLIMPLRSQLGKWIRTDLGVRTFQGLGKNSPSRKQVVRRITRDLHTHRLIESLDCEIRPRVPLHCRCLPGCGHATSLLVMLRLASCIAFNLAWLAHGASAFFSFPSSFGVWCPHPFQKMVLRCVVSWGSLKMLKRTAQTMFPNLK